jgi:hypothetical protein
MCTQGRQQVVRSAGQPVWMESEKYVSVIDRHFWASELV